MVENVKHLIVNHFDTNIDVSDLNDEKGTRISLIKFDIFFYNLIESSTVAHTRIYSKEIINFFFELHHLVASVTL